jgi:hypothetical protein
MAEKYDREELEHTSEEKKIGIPPSPDVDTKDGLRTVDNGLSPEQVLAQIEEENSRRILRKIDWRLVPLLSFLYL